MRSIIYLIVIVFFGSCTFDQQKINDEGNGVQTPIEGFDSLSQNDGNDFATGSSNAETSLPDTSTVISSFNPDNDGEEFNLDQEGDLFNYTEIGSQVWMKENLGVKHFRNGDLIPFVSNMDSWQTASAQGQPAWCYLNFDPSSLGEHGVIYNWYAVNDSRGLAPAGWHVPSVSEWKGLINNLGGENGAYTSFMNKEVFNAGNGGSLGVDSRRFSIGPQETWAAAEADQDLAYFIILERSTQKVSVFFENKGEGMYVRCMRDR